MALSINLKEIGDVAKGLRQALINDIPAEKKAEIELELIKIENETIQAQLAVNQAEASNQNFFIAGARPFILWTGGFIIFFMYIVRPILIMCKLPFPDIDMGDLWPVITGILGLSGMRSYEKKNGVQNKH